MRYCLVTGSAGFIGSHVVKALQEKGENVIGVDLNDETQSDLFFKMNIAEPAVYEKLGEYRFERVFHFASPSSVIHFHKELERCYSETVMGQLRLMKFNEKKKPEKYIFPSTSAVYGGLLPPHSESRMPAPMNIYAASKIACEAIAAQSTFKNWVAMRIFAGYGEGEEKKGEYASPLCHFLVKMMHGEAPVIWGDGLQSRDFIHIDDVVHSTMALFDSDFKGVINIGTGKLMNFNNLVGLISDELGTTSKSVYVGRPTNYVENLVCDCSLMQKVVGAAKVDIKCGIGKFHAYLKKVEERGTA